MVNHFAFSIRIDNHSILSLCSDIHLCRLQQGCHVPVLPVVLEPPPIGVSEAPPHDVGNVGGRFVVVFHPSLVVASGLFPRVQRVQHLPVHLDRELGVLRRQHWDLVKTCAKVSRTPSNTPSRELKKTR